MIFGRFGRSCPVVEEWVVEQLTEDWLDEKFYPCSRCEREYVDQRAYLKMPCENCIQNYIQDHFDELRRGICQRLGEP